MAAGRDCRSALAVGGRNVQFYYPTVDNIWLYGYVIPLNQG